MTERIHAGMKILLALNCLAIVGFGLLWLVHPDFTSLDVVMKCTALDRAGVIDRSALDRFNGGHGLTVDARSWLPRYIAGAAIEAQRGNAFCGLILSVLNAGAIIYIRAATRRRPAIEAPTEA